METFEILARYNRWMNQRLFQACSGLTQQQLELEQGAFFGSIYRTLHHLLIVDSFWLFQCSKDKALNVLIDEAGTPLRPQSAQQILFPAFPALRQARFRLDDHIVDFIQALPPQRLNESYHHVTQDGRHLDRQFSVVLAHWFNHQTHHRGQITTLLTQQNVDVGVTDLMLADI